MDPGIRIAELMQMKIFHFVPITDRSELQTVQYWYTGL